MLVCSLLSLMLIPEFQCPCFREICAAAQATGPSWKVSKVLLRMPGLELVPLNPTVVAEEPRMEFAANKTLQKKGTIKVLMRFRSDL